MKFAEYPYERPVMDEFSKSFTNLLDEFSQASSFEQQDLIFTRINDLRAAFESMYNICHIRHTMDTRDKFYEDENDFFDQQMPNLQALVTEMHRRLLDSRFRKEMEDKWGKQIFVIAELTLKTFRPEILEDLKEENQLSSEYVKLKAGARILLDGEEYNLSSIQPKEIDPDRETRRAASRAKWKFYEDNQEAIETLFDKLVKVRHRIAQKLGYRNFSELAYARLLRSDYDAAMVANFRKQVKTHIVPIATELFNRQRHRLQLDTLKIYDEDYHYRSGNPKPKGDANWIIENAGKMYKSLSRDTDEFFQFMRDNGLMDLVAKDGKATGGYCTYVAREKAPFIFSNFNGTSGDIYVLTHEAGHAFQVYASRGFKISEYQWPTYEACEIHSMSMEFFTWPWMELFFGEDTDKYKYGHLAGAIQFLPYGVAIDEFQHFVYEHAEATPAERNSAWKDIEAKYLPHRDYDGHPYLESGGFWQKQSHIFFAPFYYIDYTLAQICAFQFWKKDAEDHNRAWEDYIRLCRAGGSKSFLDLVELAKLRSPFEEDAVASVVGNIKSWLDRVDDGTF